MSNEKNELMTTEASTYLTDPVNLNELFSEELDGLRPSFERIKIPAGGGISYEVPGDDPDSPDTAKEFTAVILHHHPVNSYFKDKFNGSSNPPDCASIDGTRKASPDGSYGCRWPKASRRNHLPTFPQRYRWKAFHRCMPVPPEEFRLCSSVRLSTGTRSRTSRHRLQPSCKLPSSRWKTSTASRP